MASDVAITPWLTIPSGEIEVRTSRASGPGGQGVNTTDSRVELRFCVVASPTLNTNQRARLLERLSSQLDRQGCLRIVAQRQRSQLANRNDALERFRRVLSNALRPVPQRRSTRPTAGAVERRLRAKRAQAQRKQQRRGPPADDMA